MIKFTWVDDEDISLPEINNGTIYFIRKKELAEDDSNLYSGKIYVDMDDKRTQFNSRKNIYSFTPEEFNNISSVSTKDDLYFIVEDESLKLACGDGKTKIQNLSTSLLISNSMKENWDSKINTLEELVSEIKDFAYADTGTFIYTPQGEVQSSISEDNTPFDLNINNYTPQGDIVISDISFNGNSTNINITTTNVQNIETTIEETNTISEISYQPKGTINTPLIVLDENNTQTNCYSISNIVSPGIAPFLQTSVNEECLQLKWINSQPIEIENVNINTVSPQYKIKDNLTFTGQPVKISNNIINQTQTAEITITPNGTITFSSVFQGKSATLTGTVDINQLKIDSNFIGQTEELTITPNF